MPQLNGREYQQATVDFTVVLKDAGTFTFTSFSALNYKTGRPVEFVRDQKGTQKGHVIKDEDTSGASFTPLMSEWESFRAWRRAAVPTKLLQALEFSAIVTYGEPEAGNLITDILEGVFFTEEARAISSDQNALGAPVPLAIKHVFLNGERPVY